MRAIDNTVQSVRELFEQRQLNLVFGCSTVVLDQRLWALGHRMLALAVTVHRAAERSRIYVSTRDPEPDQTDSCNEAGSYMSTQAIGQYAGHAGASEVGCAEILLKNSMFGGRR